MKDPRLRIYYLLFIIYYTTTADCPHHICQGVRAGAWVSDWTLAASVSWVPDRTVHRHRIKLASIAPASHPPFHSNSSSMSKPLATETPDNANAECAGPASEARRLPEISFLLPYKNRDQAAV